MIYTSSNKAVHVYIAAAAKESLLSLSRRAANKSKNDFIFHFRSDGFSNFHFNFNICAPPFSTASLYFSAYSSIRTRSSTRLLIRRYAYANVAAVPWAQIQFHRKKKDERSVCRPTDITPIQRRRKKSEKWIWISLSCFFFQCSLLFMIIIQLKYELI